MNSAHKFHATLRKTHSEEWDSLLKEDVPNPNNLQKWFEMEEKFIKQDQLEEEDEDYEVLEEKISKKKKRKTPKVISGVK